MTTDAKRERRPPWQRWGLEILGWVLVLAGIAALVLPGPGLLLLAAGLWVHSQSYEWADRMLDPVKRAAYKGAADSVQSWPKIVLSSLFALGISVRRRGLGAASGRSVMVAHRREVVARRRLGHRRCADRFRHRGARPDRLELPDLPGRPRHHRARARGEGLGRGGLDIPSREALLATTIGACPAPAPSPRSWWPHSCSSRSLARACCSRSAVHSPLAVATLCSLS